MKTTAPEQTCSGFSILPDGNACLRSIALTRARPALFLLRPDSSIPLFIGQGKSYAIDCTVSRPKVRTDSHIKYYGLKYPFLGPILIGLFLMSASALAGGRRPPEDPATWGDVLNARTYTREVQIESQQADAATNARVTDLSDRVDQLEATKVIWEPVIRFFDGKRFALEAYNQMDVAQANEVAVGLRTTIKLGKSYTEKLIEKQAAEIAALRALIEKGVSHE